MKPKKRSDSSTASIEDLSRTSGRSWRFTKKRLQECGLFPPDKHPRRLLLAALRRPEPTDAATSVRERKTFEEWRKLKIRNDREEAGLIDRAAVAATVKKLVRSPSGVDPVALDLPQLTHITVWNLTQV